MNEVIAALEGILGPDRAGPFNSKEEHPDQLEKCAHQYHFRCLASPLTAQHLSLVIGAVLILVVAWFLRQ
jgi:hypothetical protein